MTTDNNGAQAKADMIAKMDASIDVEDAIRAAKDRPSMEAELMELRAKHQALLDSCPPHLEVIARIRQLEEAVGIAQQIQAERDALRREVERLRSELEAEEGAHAMCVKAASHFNAMLQKLAAGFLLLEDGERLHTDEEWAGLIAIARAALAKMEGGR